MRKRLIEAGVGLLGLVVIALAVASATLWRADDVLVARGTATAGLVVTDPGVLELGGDPVTVRAQVPAGARVVLAVGRDTDVNGWVGGDAHQRVSGLSGWRSLRLVAPAPSTAPSPAGASGSPSSSAPTATASTGSAPSGAAAPGATASASPTAAATPAADPTGSDMWVAQATGTGSAQLVWHAQEGRWSLLVAGIGADGAAVNPTIEMSWPRVVSSPWLVPGLVLGSLLVLAGAALLGRDWWRARTGHDGWTSVETGSVPEVVAAGTAPVLTRRQLRELQSRSGRPPTGAVQAVGAADARVAGTVPPPPGSSSASPSRAGASGIAPAAPRTGASSAERRDTPPWGSAARPAPGTSVPAAVSGPVAPPAAPFTRSTPGALTAAEAARQAASAHPPRQGAGAPPAGAAARTTPTGQVPPRRLGAAGGPAPSAPADQPAPPWAVGGRRARRTGSAQPDAPLSGGVASRSGAPTHEGRPAWAPLAPAPDTAGAPRADRPSAGPAAPLVRPAAPPAPAAQTTAGRAHPQPDPSTPRPASGQPRAVPPVAAPRTAQPPRPGGWVPIPDAAAEHPGAPGDERGRRPAGSAGEQPPVHPSWLVSRPDQQGPVVARTPTVQPPAAAPPSGQDRIATEDESDDSPSARADAWRRAWGLPTEPPADDRGGEGR